MVLRSRSVVIIPGARGSKVVVRCLNSEVISFILIEQDLLWVGSRKFSLLQR